VCHSPQLVCAAPLHSSVDVPVPRLWPQPWPLQLPCDIGRQVDCKGIAWNSCGCVGGSRGTGGWRPESWEAVAGRGVLSGGRVPPGAQSSAAAPATLPLQLSSPSPPAPLAQVLLPIASDPHSRCRCRWVLRVGLPGRAARLTAGLLAVGRPLALPPPPPTALCPDRVPPPCTTTGDAGLAAHFRAAAAGGKGGGAAAAQGAAACGVPAAERRVRAAGRAGGGAEAHDGALPG
jgi:hypothetical protein